MKKVSIKSVVMLFAALIMTGIAFSQTVSEFKTKIEALNKEMARNMITGNFDKSLSLYTNDAISLPSGMPIEEGIAAIRKASDDMRTKGIKYNSFEPVTLKVIAAGNLITEVGTYKISMSKAGMEKPIDDHGKYVTVWEKQKDGSLKIKIETWNSDIDPMSMMNMAHQPKIEKK